MDDVKHLLNKRNELKHELRDIDRQLMEEITSFDGKLVDALGMGLVRLNFAAPVGFRRYLTEAYQNK